MLRLYLKLMVSPLILFAAAAMVLVHIQPNRDLDLRSLFIPDNCQMPCFMGIRPGLTTDAEAIKILQASGWIKSLSRLTNSDSDLIQWEWNGTQPTWIDAHVNPGIRTQNRIVMIISISTNAALGDLELDFGRASQNIVLLTDSTPSRWVQYAAYYPQTGVVLQTNTLCSLHKTLNASTFITYYEIASFPTDWMVEHPKPVYSLCES